MGFPPALLPSGFVVGDDSTYRFLGAMDRFVHAAWHQDFDWTLGIPAVQGGTIFMGVGGIGAARGIAALDAATGEGRWLFGTERVASDPLTARTLLMPQRRLVLSRRGLAAAARDQQAARDDALRTASRAAAIAGGLTAGTPAPTRGANGREPAGGAPAAGMGAREGARRADAALTRALALPGAGTAVAPRRGAAPAGAGRMPLPQAAATSQPRVPGTPEIAQTPAEVLLRQGMLEPAYVPVPVPGPVSPLPPGHWSNAGVVLARGRVFGEVNHAIVSLNPANGAAGWRYGLGDDWVARSLAATPEHLICCISRAGSSSREPVWSARSAAEESLLLALRLEDGVLAWSHPLKAPGVLSLSGGVAFLANGNLHAFGPAERTFSLGVNSPHAGDYASPRKDRPGDPRREISAARRFLGLCAVQTGPAAAPPPAKSLTGGVGGDPLADATFLRLNADEPQADLLRKLAERRQQAPGVPLALGLEWLNAERTGARGPDPERLWTAGGQAEFAERCRALAAAGRPEWFDVAPEINVYLARRPDRLAAAGALLRAVRNAVRQASPATKVVATFNAEVLRGVYGKGSARPFGDLRAAEREGLTAFLALAADVDGMGLVCRPEAGFKRAGQIGPDYLLVLKKALVNRPLLLVRLEPLAKPGAKKGELEPDAGLKRLVQCCYWLDSGVVVGPDWLVARHGEGSPPPPAGGPPPDETWRDTLGWKKVQRLTLAQP